MTHLKTQTSADHRYVQGQLERSKKPVFEHLEENIAAASLQLSDEEFHKLSRVPQLAAAR